MKLTNFPVLSKSNGENETNSGKLNNRTKGICNTPNYTIVVL